jgi:flagellum-specific ATP synthase
LALSNLIDEVAQLPASRRYGRVTGVLGMLLEVGGVPRQVAIGGRTEVLAQDGRRVLCEVVGFRNGQALLLPFGALDGIGLGCKVEIVAQASVIYPHESWLGRVINALGQPIDGKGPLIQGRIAYQLRNPPPPAHARKRVQGKIDLGVRSLNTFLSCCRGQRMGIFSGSGVGKSILLSMLARYTAADATVIGLIGERGREVQEFLEDDLGPEGLARSIVVVATSDESPLRRRQAAHMTLSVAEFLRDGDRDVLCLIDSLTRFATAQREIGLSAGEPPTTKGYTPTVFAELPKLLERAGTGIGKGSITGLFSVLVEGDDQNEPIADACRAILDGHIVLDRAIAERGRFPAVDILRSMSRSMPQCNSEAENNLVGAARGHIATYENMAELIRLGAYRRGSDALVDQAIQFYPALDAFLAQKKEERADLAGGYAALAAVLGGGAK